MSGIRGIKILFTHSLLEGSTEFFYLPKNWDFNVIGTLTTVDTNLSYFSNPILTPSPIANGSWNVSNAGTVKHQLSDSKFMDVTPISLKFRIFYD